MLDMDTTDSRSLSMTTSLLYRLSAITKGSFLHMNLAGQAVSQM